MWEHSTDPGPDDHSARPLFRKLTERAFEQIDIRDEDSVLYLSAMMAGFIRMEAVYPVRAEDGSRLEYLSDLIAEADRAREPEERLNHFRHLGDLTLFMLGLFPERFLRHRRALSREFYVAQGRRSYAIVADLVPSPAGPTVFRRLADQYERYVEGLDWVRLYIRDPFLQYMFREFGVS